MTFSEFKYLGRRPTLHRRDIGDRKITKECYINSLLSVKLVNKYTLTCINDLELTAYSQKGSEFDKQVEKLKNWHDNGYSFEFFEFKEAFPLLWELSNLGDSKAREVYYSLIYQKDKLDLLINPEIYKFFTDIYQIFLKYLEEGTFRLEKVDNIKLNDLCLLYHDPYSFDNDFYMMIWSTVKKNLNLPFSIQDENLVNDIFSLFEVDFYDYYENVRYDYRRLYNRKFFEEILNPLFQRIFESKSSLIVDFNSEMDKPIDHIKLTKMVLIDCIVRYFGKENLLKATQNTNLLTYIKKIINYIKMLHYDDCWDFYSAYTDFFDYKFYLALEDFLVSIQDNSVVLTEDLREIEDLLLFIEEMKMEIQKRDERFFEYYE